MTGGFSQPDIAGNDGREDFFSKKGLQIRHHLIGKVSSFIEHREQNTLDLQSRIRRPPDLADGLHQLRHPFERKVLTLDWNQDTVGGYQSVDRENVQ